MKTMIEIECFVDVVRDYGKIGSLRPCSNLTSTEKYMLLDRLFFLSEPQIIFTKFHKILVLCSIIRQGIAVYCILYYVLLFLCWC